MEEMKMYLSGQKSSAYKMKNQFTINGAYLIASNSTLGYNLYRLKVFEDESLQNDPKFKCKKYARPRDYEKV